jgi:hypothetical protein
MIDTVRKLLVAFCLTSLALASDHRPRIRAVTAFIEVDSSNYAAKIEETQKFLASAKEALNHAGFEGAGGRITTRRKAGQRSTSARR